MGPDVCVVVNPVAGHGKTLRVLDDVKAFLDERKVNYEVVVTKGPGAARDIALKRCDSGAKIIVAMGGDGTLGEVADGILASGVPGVAAASIPLGTGNDFVGGNRLFPGWREAVAALASPCLWHADVLEVKDNGGFKRNVINSVGIGYDAYVVKRVCSSATKKIGKMSYMVEAFRGLFRFRPQDMTITVDSVQSHHKGVWLFAVTNSGNFGGGMRVSPQALSDDGEMDIAILEGVPRFALVSLLFSVRSGKHVGREGVSLSCAKHAVIDAPPGFPCHVDGDVVEVSYPLQVRLIPGGLPFVRCS